MRRPFTIGILCIATMLLANSAHAGLLGRTLDAVYDYPDLSSPYSFASFTPLSFTVGAGVETVGNVEGVTSLPVDVTDDTLTIELDTILASPTWNVASFNGIVFTLGSPGTLGIVSAVVDGATTLGGFDNSRLSVTNDQIRIDWNGLAYSNGVKVVADFHFVPEPSTLSLIVLGLVGLSRIRSKLH
jgi:PEP-CTERM motif